MPESIWLDGRLAPAAGAHLSATDRGFQLGDGVFETLRARRGVAIELREHLDRLRESAAATEIPLPDEDQIVRGIGDLLRAEGLDGSEPPGDAAMRITASRGPVEGRGMAISPDAAGTLVIQAWPFAPPAAALLERGVRVTIATLRRDASSPLAGVKSTSRAESVHAKLEASRRGADDALMLTLDGDLSEATSANLFLVRGRELLTPPLSAAILAGTTRTWLLERRREPGTDAARAQPAPRRPPVRGRGVPVEQRGRHRAADAPRRAADRRRDAGHHHGPPPSRAGAVDRRRVPGRPGMTREELILRTRQLIAEGERLQLAPTQAGLQVWLQLSDDLLLAAWGRMDRYHLAWLMVGKPKNIVRGRPMTPDEEAAYVREVARQKTAALGASLDAVERQGMPFVGETGGVGSRP